MTCSNRKRRTDLLRSVRGERGVNRFGPSKCGNTLGRLDLNIDDVLGVTWLSRRSISGVSAYTSEALPVVVKDYRSLSSTGLHTSNPGRSFRSAAEFGTLCGDIGGYPRRWALAVVFGRSWTSEEPKARAANGGVAGMSDWLVPRGLMRDLHSTGAVASSEQVGEQTALSHRICVRPGLTSFLVWAIDFEDRELSSGGAVSLRIDQKPR
jgi:hypothetical protein